MPALSANASESATPTTSSAPKSRTIGTGESSSTRKPTAVASAAVAIVGAAVRAARTGGPPGGSSLARACHWIA